MTWKPPMAFEPEEMKTYLFGFYAAVSNSEVIEGRGKGKGQNRGKGKGRHPGGKAGVITRMKIESLRYRDCVTAQKVTIPFRKCDKCDHNMLDGTAKCPSCYVSMEAWSDNRVATDVCRLESRAAEISGVFALNQVSQVQPRNHRVGSEARQRNRAGRSNFGVMKDGAKKEVKKLKKTGFATIRERMENDLFFMYNSRSSPRPAAIPCIAWAAASPPMWAGPLRHNEKARGPMTRLVFMPLPGRDASRPLDVKGVDGLSLGSILLACPICCLYGKVGSSARGTRAVGLWLFRKSSCA